MQNKITKPSDLLNKKGELIQKGYATSPILNYNRKKVAKKCRLKEWDYYLINNEDHAFAITVAKSMCFLLISITIIDFHKKKQHTKTLIKFAPRLKMPTSSEIGDIIYNSKNVKISIIHENFQRKIKVFMKDFEPGSNLDASIRITNEPKDSMVIATPFKENKKFFYYNQKIVGMAATGIVQQKDSCFSYNTGNSFALLDWGRGVWPRKTTWYWSALQCLVANNIFGFNLGFGFGDTSAATENMLFWNGNASKLNKVIFHIPINEKGEYEYMKPWLIQSTDNRLEMTFKPIIDRSAKVKLFLFSTNQHQVFGNFSGRALLEDGTVVYFKDFIGFAEHVENVW